MASWPGDRHSPRLRWKDCKGKSDNAWEDSSLSCHCVFCSLTSKLSFHLFHWVISLPFVACGPPPLCFWYLSLIYLTYCSCLSQGGYVFIWASPILAGLCFAPNVMKFHIYHVHKIHKVTETLTSDPQLPISSFLTPSEHLHQIWRNSLKAFPR